MRVSLPALLAAAALALPASASAGLFEANHPKVEAGTDAYNKGDYEGALRHFEEARKELPKRPEVLYNLGDVYMKLGRTDDAKRAYEAALSGADDALKARDYFNLGNAFATLNQTEDAIAAYRQALKVDPHLEPARRNLELLLRKQKEPPKDKKPTPGDGGTPDAGVPDAGQDGGQGDASQQQEDAGQDGGQGDGGESDGGALDGGTDGGMDAGADGGQGDGGTGDGGGQMDAGSPDAGEQQDGGGGQGESEQPDGGSPDAGEPDGGSAAQPEETSVAPENVYRQEAEQLLDAVRRNEKQFLMHQKKSKGKKSAHPDKDW